MDLREAFQLLTLASARDGRTVDKEVAAVWAKDLERVDIGDAVEAATDHYRRSDKWLMPSHVIDGVRIVRERRERAARIQRALEASKTPTTVGDARPADYWTIVEQHRRMREEA
jgi:hypothetical protein